MGTRNLICVFENGEYRIAQYCQWDGYPSGQGVDVLNFLKNKKRVNGLRKSLNRVRFLEPEGKDKGFYESYEANTPEWSNEPDNRTVEQKYWFDSYISRDIGANILSKVSESREKEIILKNSIGFAGDSLFCEWAYVIDFDGGVLEVYSGFNKTLVTDGRFKSNDPALEKNEGWEPIVLIKSYSLDNLPSPSKFVADLGEE